MSNLDLDFNAKPDLSLPHNPFSLPYMRERCIQYIGNWSNTPRNRADAVERCGYLIHRENRKYYKALVRDGGRRYRRHTRQRSPVYSHNFGRITA